MPEPETRVLSRRGLRLAASVAIVVALFVVITGIATRASDAARLRERADAQALPTVALITPQKASASPTLDLPGRLEAYTRAPIYARVSGYLKSWKADIGTAVKAGQLLAEIETPDLDQQILQARADLSRARADATLAESTAKRWQSLLASDSVARQEAEEKAGDFATKRALTTAAQANLDRFMTLKSFARIVAPFDGVVTARSTDVGALINAGSGAGPELFVVSDTRKLRVYVSVPQNYASKIRRGAKARISVPERRGQFYSATVESLAQAVNASSGSMLIQLIVDNGQGELLPGAFANVSLDLPRAADAWTIPPSALIFNKSGLRVATVSEEGKVLLKPVTIARDLGKVIEIASGIEAGERVIESPPDGIADGDAVRLAGTGIVPGGPQAAAGGEGARN